MPALPTSPAEVLAALAETPDPESGRGLVAMDQIRDIRIEGDRLSLTVALTTHSAPLWSETLRGVEQTLQRAFPGLREVRLERTIQERPINKLGQIGLTAKSVVAVGSGKGGVGKSTMAASLAYGLLRAGCRVGLMDADVYGPSIPHLVGVNQRPQIEDNRIQPIEAHGLKTMSMGFLVPPGDPVVWRGPMLHGAIQQFLRDTNWGPLDYLIIDLPPGTGDIAITLSQLLPLSGAVVVCTPQDVALLDAVKAIAMFRKVNIPLLGMIENMSYFACPNCGERYDIFGSGGAERRAAELDVPFLGAVPINIQIRVNGDQGRVGATFDDRQTAPHFEQIVYNLAKNLAGSSRPEPPLPTLSVIS